VVFQYLGLSSKTRLIDLSLAIISSPRH
jgi:hypothetical protein